jgi:hypothetical protein
MIRNQIASLLSAKPSGKKYAALANLLLASSPTTHSDGSVTWDPPARYDKPFDGNETIKMLPQPEVVEACRKLFADAGLKIKVTPKQKGCAVYKGQDGTIIVIDKPFMGVTPEAAIKHERGHLNGWHQDHRD